MLKSEYGLEVINILVQAQKTTKQHVSAFGFCNNVFNKAFTWKHTSVRNSNNNREK